jgi:hypothetical protein
LVNKKKYEDFKDFKLVGSLIYSGKHTTATGFELIDKIRKGMNNYRLSTNINSSDREEIPQQLLDDVLNMEEVYCKNEDGLRINISTLAIIPGQLFYISAVAPGAETKIFNNSLDCAEYFGTTRQTINKCLALNKPILNKEEQVQYTLTRKAI